MVSTRGSQQASAGRTSLNGSVNSEISTEIDISTGRPNGAFGQLSSVASRTRKRRRTGISPTAELGSKVSKSTPAQSTPTQIHREEPPSTSSFEQPPFDSFYADAHGELDQLDSDTVAMLDSMDASQLQAGDSAFSSRSLNEQEVYEEIVDHVENTEKRYFEQHDAPDDQDTYVAVDASLHLKIQSLPILDNLSNQILNTLARSTYQDIITLISEPQSEPGQAYQTLKSLFDHTKKVYSLHDQFLSPTDLQLTNPDDIEIIRKANLTTFVSSVFGSSDVGFFALDKWFLPTFVPDGQRLLKVQGALFLELKTQAYMSALHNKDRSRQQSLSELFPDDIEDRLHARRPGARQLAPSEADFVKRAHSRRDYLLKEVNNEEVIASLPDKYRWENFLRDLSSYINKHIGNDPNGEKLPKGTNQPKGGRRSLSNGDSQEIPQIELENKFPLHAQPIDQSPEANTTQEDMVEKAARAARIALSGNGINMSHFSPPIQQESQSPAPPPQMQTTFLQITYPTPHETAQSQPSNQPLLGDIPEIPYHTQSAPTQVLYERARQAAVTKVSPSSRRAGLPSQRRPWSTEEENALMAGLDRVKGPHWSQILAMFGPGGTINETLKDRNQVQLKDKARNLKLFFLKSGIEVPYYLQFVTGELKTRAPAQAAKNEAREREQSAYDDDKAHIEGVMGVLGLANASQMVEDGTNGASNANADGSGGQNGVGQGFDQIAGDQIVQYATNSEPVNSQQRKPPRRMQITGGVTTT